MTTIYKTADGNPRKLRELSERLRRETGERDLQFIGACMMLVMMFAWYFFSRSQRKVL